MKDSMKSLDFLWKVELQKKPDAGMTSRKGKTEELQKKAVIKMFRCREKVILVPLLEVSPQNYQANNT